MNLLKNSFIRQNPKNTDFDSEKGFKFHATLAMKDIHQKFDDIWSYLKNYSIVTKGICYRITLLKKWKNCLRIRFSTKKDSW